ncbi:MAG: DNA alkylation repair protein [Actinomycetota bacterium]
MANAAAAAPTPSDLVAQVEDALAAIAEPDQAESMAAYMKDQFPFLGVKAGPRREAQRSIINALAGRSADDLLAFAEHAWIEEDRELQYVACDALRKHVTVLTPPDLPRVEALIVTKAWWDTVDSLAVHTVGPLVAAHPELSATMDTWIDGSDMWKARTAILHQLMYKADTDPDRLFGYADRRAEDTEFFIRKAIGWALRQYARTDPDAVRSFVAANDDRLSGLTKREALKHL